MYALINNQQLLLGPIAFNYRMINSVLEEELELDYRVTSQDYQNVPINITDTVKIIPARNDIPEHDPRLNYLTGPIHEITDTEVIFHYEVSDKPIQQIKDEYKALVAPERWNRENTIIQVTINDQQISVSTDRENRLSLVSKMLSGDGPFDFKFQDGVWLNITKSDIQNILTEIDKVVQAAFDWEVNKLAEIDACTTGEEVYSVVITEPQQGLI
jgi:methyl coenzyme M reductase subunit D